MRRVSLLKVAQTSLMIGAACSHAVMRPPLHVDRAATLVEPRRSFSISNWLRCAQPSPAAGAAAGSSADGGASADAAASALDIAMRVNKLKRLHQTGGNANTGKKQLEFTAWKELNTLNEDQINHAEGKAVALLLNSWAYFAKFWEKGKDGPHGTGEDVADQEAK